MIATLRGADVVRALVATAVVLVAAVPAQGALGSPTATSGETPAPTVAETPAPTVSPAPDPTATVTPTPVVTPTRTPAPDDRLLPDLVALAASRPTIQGWGNKRVLRFQSSLANIGRGPVEVRPSRAHPCPSGQRGSTQIVYRDVNGNQRYNLTTDTAVRRSRAGCMVYHRYHQHWHFNASARYTLVERRSGERNVIAARRKVSFCLRDSARAPERYGTSGYRETYGACTRNSAQGISVGWMDVYQRFLAGQSLRLPKGFKDGIYCLETTVDPLNQLLESRDDNRSIRALAIKGNRAAVRDTRHCR